MAESGERIGGPSCSARRGRWSSKAVVAAVIDDTGNAGPIGSSLDQSCAEARAGGDNTITAKPLVVVYWNVAGIAVGNIDTFLDDMDQEVAWDILILVDFPRPDKSCSSRVS